LRAAVITADPEFPDRLRGTLADSGHGLNLDIEITQPFTEIDDTELERMRAARPDVTFLDVEDEPHVGLKFAQFIVDSGFTGAIIALGPTDSPELILAAMQAGVTEYVSKPVDADTLGAAVDRVLRKSGRRSDGRSREPGKLLMIFSAKGGTGSTTIAANLATEMHRLTRKRTLLVDLDLELGESALIMGVQPRFSIVDLVRNFHRVDSRLLASYIERHETGVEILSAPYQPADYEAVSTERIKQVLQFLKKHYDYIIIDAPKTFTPATMGAFEEADSLYLLTTADIPSLRNLTRCVQLIRSFGRRKGDDWMRVLVNRFDPNQVVTKAEIEKTLGIDVFWTLRNDYRTVMNSINTGQPAVSDAKSAFAKDIRGLASRLTETKIESGKSGWLGGLFGRNGREPID
jgi:pilus assembly protein CpaE